MNLSSTVLIYIYVIGIFFVLNILYSQIIINAQAVYLPEISTAN